MEDICLLGDAHTVTAWRFAGIRGIVADRGDVLAKLEELRRHSDVSIVLVTRELAETIPEQIYAINIDHVWPVVLEIPALDDVRGFGRSSLSLITEALGMRI